MRGKRWASGRHAGCHVAGCAASYRLQRQQDGNAAGPISNVRLPHCGYIGCIPLSECALNWAVERARSLKKDDSPNVFGVILFTQRHPNLRRVLHDRLYWDALDEVSGDRWQIFATVAAMGHWDRAPDLSATQSLPNGAIFQMQQVWIEPSENKELLADFQLDDTSSLPSLLVFGELTDGDFYRLTIRLDDSSIERAFASLKGAIGAVTTALEDVLPENFSNVEGVFAAIDLSVTSYKQFNWLKRALPIASLVAKLSKSLP